MTVEPVTIDIDAWRVLVKSDPVAQRERATAALNVVGRGRHDQRAALHEVLASAALELDQPGVALHHARVALRAARRDPSATPERLAELRVLHVRTLVFAGRLATALHEADDALPLVHGAVRGRLLVQRTFVLYKLGRLPEALAAVNAGLALLIDPVERAKALNNRGVLQLYVGGFAAGLDDFEAAERIYRAEGLTVGAADAAHSRGLMLARLGRVPEALRAFLRSEAELRALAVPTDLYALAAGQVLLAANLVDEVAEAVGPAVTSLEAAGMITDAAEGRLLLAQALAVEGRPAAVDEARRARAAFAAHRRTGWAALARLAELRARVCAGDHSVETLTVGRHAANELARSGQFVVEPEARLLLGRLALTLGRRREAERQLGRVVEAGARRGPVLRRVAACEADARLALLRGDRRRARRCVERGLHLIEGHRASLGATDLRALASAHGDALATIGVDLALQAGQPRDVLRWAERWRASALWLRPTLPPASSGLRELLAELRHAHETLRAAELAGDATPAHLELVVDVERRIRSCARLEGGVTGVEATSGARLASELMDALEDRVLVEIIDFEQALTAIVVSAHGCRLVPLGATGTVQRGAEGIAFALRRLASGRGSAAAQASARALVEREVAGLREALIGPIERDVEHREVVVVPPAALHIVPWGLVLAGQAVSVCPSARLWLRARRAASRDGGVALVAGPRLDGADDEIGRLGDVYRGARVLSGTDATVAATTAAIDGAGVAHIAAHAHVRWDNPMFSALELCDGPATVYDLEQLSQAPTLVVLSACNSGLSAVRASDEIVGLTAAILSLGTSTLLASVLPVPDIDAAPLMEAFHVRLRDGAPPARAWAATMAAATDPGGPAGASASAYAAAASFVVLGAG